MALVTLGFFLHSNATWSLHSLWQFIPQSAGGRGGARNVRTRTGSIDMLPVLEWMNEWIYRQCDLFYFHIQITNANTCKTGRHVPMYNPSVWWIPEVKYHSFTPHTEITHLFRRVEEDEAADWFSLCLFISRFYALQSEARSVQLTCTTKSHTTALVRNQPLQPRLASSSSSSFTTCHAAVWPKGSTRQSRNVRERDHYLCICILAWWRPTAAVRKHRWGGRVGEGGVGYTIRAETANGL